ncbi:pyridoxamine 5'-phosphate oxidase family protein [Rhizobium phaseoli]|uniref:pyridoxamine 5'-phosphate oxidase family protein n=1 Tax=Rhizobium phaseoli TaxID=396 RepID=UPI0007E99A57|nr:pyridoxamine 5'-phosphate oxidase family protein [Rhizobium phaseoli]ANL37470.1 pyridoxamine 5'-phosphate oxidase-like protein [Rhizobium phaseoli]ANM01181.1 pyridoxamine 5'-phosphate oxidase-like protein [Rhizobium phaseoli]
MDLTDIDAAAWAELETAAADPQSGFRYLNLCSVDAEARPQARMVVLRAADRAARHLEFHTDIRSPKWLELSANPHVTVLGFSAGSRLQLRLQGKVELHGPGSGAAEAAWDRLPARTRMTYAGGPPGDQRAFQTTDMPEPADVAEGKARFGLLIFQARTLDWFQLRQQDNRRALFCYDEAGALASCRWGNP